MNCTKMHITCTHVSGVVSDAGKFDDDTSSCLLPFYSDLSLRRAPEALNPLKALAMVAREKKKEQGGVKEDSRKRKLTTLEEIRLVRVCGLSLDGDITKKK